MVTKMNRTEFAARHWKNGQWVAAPAGTDIDQVHEQLARVKARKVRELRPKVVRRG
jgi:hypothetical protein